MKPFKRISILLAGVLLAGSALATEPYPSKPVMIMVPYPAGGLSDVIGRVVSTPLGKQLGQPVLVENMGGVSGAIGAQKVLAAPSDGYYVFQGSPNELILSPLANAAVKFKSEDFRLVQMIGEANMVMVARKDLPANSADELVLLARARAHDKPLTYGSVGIGSFYHLLGEHLAKTVGAPMTHVPYKGIAPLVQDMVGGQVDFALMPYGKNFAELAAQGRIKILGTLSNGRVEALKPLPSVNEGKLLKDFSFTIWTGYFVKKDTPEPIVQKLHKALTDTLGDTGVRSGLEAQSQNVAQPLTLAEAARFYQEGTAKFRAIARSVNLQPQ